MSSHRDWPWRRVTGLFGILFFVGMLIAVLLFGPIQPAPDDSMATIREFLAEDAAVFQTADWIVAFTMVFLFLPFAAGLRSVFATEDVDAGMWSRTMFGIAVAIVAIVGVGEAILPSTMLAFEGGAFDDAVLRLLVYADFYVFTVVLTFAMAGFLLATSIAILRTGAMWNWLGWLGTLIALVGLIGAWWPVDGDPQGPLAIMAVSVNPLFAIWSLLIAISLLRTATVSATAT